MDKDDNDYQGQALRIAGEESSKISPVLHPYALPKFEFDEGHLRFDSLVENEVFLGIPSQEGNQWIEDFSRGGSGIEFSSSAADSCSIPRHNNVWSEATSSESVEMLLKSVGQEEMVPGESIIEESDAGDELPSLTKQMDPNLRQHDKSDEVKDPDSELPSLEFRGSMSALNQNPKGEVGLLEYSSQPQDVDKSAYGCSGAIGEKTSIIVTKENLNVDLECIDEKIRENRTSLNESLNKIQDRSSSVVETERTQCFSSDIIAATGKPNVQDKVSDNSHDSEGGLQEERCKVEGDNENENSYVVVHNDKLSKSSAEVCDTDLHSTIYASTNVEVMKKCAVETTTVEIGKSTSMSTKGNSVMPTVEGCNELASSWASSRYGLIALAEVTEITLQSESKNLSLEKPSVDSEGVGGGKWQSTAVSDSPSNAGCTELNMESDMQMCHGHGSLNDRKDDYLGRNGQVGTGASIVLVQGFTSSEMQIDPSKQSEHEDNDGDNHDMFQKSISIPSAGEEEVTESLKDGDDATGMRNDDPKAKVLVSPPGPAGSSEIGREVSTEEGIQDNQVFLIQESGSENLNSDPRNIEYEVVGPSGDRKKVGFSSSDKVSEENVETTDGSQLDDLVGNESASNNEVEDTNIGSHDSVHGVPSVPDNCATDVEVFRHNKDQKSHPFAVETLPLDKKEDMQVEACINASMSSSEPRDVGIKEDPGSTSAKEVPEDCAAEVASENVNQSADMVESSDRVINVEQSVAGVCQEHSDTLSDSNLRSDGTEAADLLKLEESAADKDHGLSFTDGGGNSADVKKPNTGLGPVATDTELSQNETEKQAGNMESMVVNLPNSNVKDGNVSSVSSTPMPPQVKDVGEEERSFTFDVRPSAGLTVGVPTKGWQSVPSIQAGKISMLVEKSASTSGSRQIDPKVVQEVPRGSPQRHDKRASSGGPKVASERKPRHGSGKSGKENVRQGIHVKEIVPTRHTEKDTLCVFLSPSCTGKLMQLEAGGAECSGKKPSGVVSLSGSSLPDLNTSASTTVLFQQPFTDLQQVQLRAQIFVYGSLIQGVIPDEACMVSSFGISDGGRSFWEPAWRAFIERLHGQKPLPSSSETPVQSCSGAKASDQANKQGLSQSKVQASSKSTPSPAVNPMIPLSSPLWSISTPSCDALPTNNMARGAVLDYQALSPFHAYQTSAVRNFSGHTSAWLSQAPLPVPWVAASQSSPCDISAHFSALPTIETVKLTPAKESSMPISTVSKNASTITVVHRGGSSVLSGTSSMGDLKKGTVSHTSHSTEPKSRKRKKTSASEGVGQIALPVSRTESAPVTSHFANKGPALGDFNPVVARSQVQLVSASAADSEFSTAVSIPTPSSFGVQSNSRKSLVVLPLIDQPKSADRTLEEKALGSVDFAKVEEARLQAEEAASHAAVAVNNYQSVWSQLDKQKNSGLISDVESKLASAAAAIAAATSVAKAAAAAAKVASNAAVQAKLMADEALISNGTLNPIQSEVISLHGFVNSMGNATPASILKVGDGNNGSSSMILAAREASRRRIEAASAASRHAENLDAVLKAAELAAEAVSQAGNIVALCDPPPLNKLVEADPERYWKVSELPSSLGVKSNYVIENLSQNNSLEEVLDVSMELSERPSDKEMRTTDDRPSSHPRETSRKLTEDHIMREEDLPSVTCGEKEVRVPKSRRASNLSKTISVVPESEIGLSSTAYGNMSGTSNDNSIKENYLVEVFKEKSDFTGAWFSANVLSLKDGKALVCYTELESEEGKLKEWVPLEADGSKPPIIRLAHPMTNLMLEGTRKRRRAAVRDYTWSPGDRVDAWMGNCWHEGVIVEKNKRDETTLSIHFPAQGKTSIVKAWHLRTTLLWKDGEWTECSSVGQDYSSQCDTPQMKRVKLGSPAFEGKGKGKVPKNMDLSESRKLEESRLLPLSATEKIFNIGSTKNENKPETLRMMRSGLQKEGSKVIFGVPKPGKKRKFMEVSKHYVSDRSSKNSAPTDSEKFAKYLMPQVSGARGWKNNSKIDSKEKHAAESKTRGLKSGNPPTVSTRRLPHKGNSVISARGADNADDSGQQNQIEFLSSSNVEEGAEDPMLLSSQAPLSDVPKKIAASNAKFERLRKGKLAPAGGKSPKVEGKEKSVPEVGEPRRSNRRIQPTSRLLEGLQSSLIISKIPPVPHDRSHKSQNRGVSKGNNN